MIFTTGLGNPEGPVVLEDGSWLVTEMAPEKGCITRVSPDGQAHEHLVKTGRPNGLAVDADGTLWIAESINPPSLLRASMSGEAEMFLRGYSEGEPFLFANDLAWGPDGALYMTDSGVQRDQWQQWRSEPGADPMRLPVDGRVYRIDTRTGSITKLDSGLKFANGIAFDLQGNLYANETVTGDVFRYSWRNGGVSGSRELFCNVVDPDSPAEMKGPDGMDFSADGCLYCTVIGQGDVSVFDPDGKLLRRIPLEGKRPTNIAFGLPGDRRIYVTEQELGQIEVYDVDTDGGPVRW